MIRVNVLRFLILVVIFFITKVALAHPRLALFNQKDLTGWYAYTQQDGKQLNAETLFSVENGMIRLYGDKVGYLMSEQSFNYFELTVEYKWNVDPNFKRKYNKKNSGVMYLVPTDTADSVWPKGIQFQVKEGATGDFIFLKGSYLVINGEQTIPGKSVVSKRFTDATNPIGEWNTLTITYDGKKIRQTLNHILVNEGDASASLQGRILLQYEGYPIDYRKVEIRKL